ncbi:MAG TPA: energy transducer TonB [Flavobacterium sp.]|nr:energy transducer TonB [Flavobacterium sp.]
MKLDIFKKDWLDIVFEGRNKSYGAYELRKENPKTTMIALLIGGAIFATTMVLPMIDFGGLNDDDQEKVTMVDMAKLAPPPEEKKPLVPPPPPPPPAPKIDEVKFVKPVVVKKEEVVEEIKTIEELKDKNVGDKDIKGREDGQAVIIDEAGEGDKNATVVEDTNQIYQSVEVQPEFPGGMQAFYKWVQNNYHTPEDAADLKGRIIVTFVVEKDGSLTDIRVLRDLGYGTGKEAERMLRKSPKWKAGVQNGRSVRVQYSLPIMITPQN